MVFYNLNRGKAMETTFSLEARCAQAELTPDEKDALFSALGLPISEERSEWLINEPGACRHIMLSSALSKMHKKGLLL